MISQVMSTYGYYGFLAVGAVSMLVLTLLRRKQYDFSVLSAILFPLLLLLCGISGAKLLFFAESGFSSFGGMSFFGAVFLVLLLMPLVGLIFRLKPTQSLDACAPCVASIVGFMRFGCFCAGCCGGVICTIGSRSFCWPTQLIEGLGDMLILALLLFIEQKKGRRGDLYPVFLVTYGVMRFAIEFLRDTPKTMLCFSEGQWLALLGVLIGAIWIIVSRKVRKNDVNNTGLV